jgi:hypothetical protein
MALYKHASLSKACTMVCALATFAMVGCNANNAGSNAGASVGQAIQPSPQAVTQANPVRLRSDVSSAVDQLPGYKWSVVMQEGPTVYVGTFPQFQTNAPKGASPKNPHVWPKQYDTREDLQQQTPDDYIRALDELPPRADTYDSRPHGFSGMMSPQDQADIRKRVKDAVPGTRSVLITTDVASAALLRGYSEYIQSGGDMSRYMTTFHQRVNKIWPNGHGVAPDRPSTSPDFGTFSIAPDARTPMKSQVHP